MTWVRDRLRPRHADTADQIITGISMRVQLLIERADAVQRRKAGLNEQAGRIPTAGKDGGDGSR